MEYKSQKEFLPKPDPRAAIIFMTARVFLLLGFLFIAGPAFAQMTLVSYPTGYYTVTTTTTPATVYAGRTVNSGSCSGPLCDSCAGGAFDFLNSGGNPSSATVGSGVVCSLRETHASDSFIIYVSTQNASASGSNLYIQGGTSGTTYTVTGTTVNGYVNPTFSNGGSIQYQIPWSQICNLLSSTNDASCSTSFASQTLTIGWTGGTPPAGTTTTATGETVTINIAFRYVNASPSYSQFGCTSSTLLNDYEGFCNFTVYPGDSKGYIFPTANSQQSYLVPDLTAGGTASNADASGMTYAAILIFESLNTSAFTTALPHQDLAFSSSAGSVSPAYISGLSNGTAYYLAEASVDQAGIVTFFSDPSTTATNPENFSTTVVPPEGNSQAVIPEQVEGLLNGQTCFIATAAYGSPLAEQVDRFREFRGRYLLGSRVGRWMVRTYYRLSPPLANYIAGSEVRRLIARALLLPLLLFVRLSLWWGVWPAFLIFLAMGGLVAWAWRQRAVARKKSGLTFLALFFLMTILILPLPRTAQADDDPPADDSAKERVIRIEHPNAAKGLIRINDDKSYQYKVKEPDKTYATSFSVSALTPPSATNYVNSRPITFASMYGAGDVLGISGNYEWLPLRGAGSLGLVFETGISTSHGNGVLASTPPEPSIETYTLIIVPLSFLLKYRFEYVRHQSVVPYVEGALTYYGLAEIRSDGAQTNIAGASAVGGGGGLAINISGSDSIFNLRSEFGVSDLWLNLEGRQMVGLKPTLDFSNTTANVGITVDY